MALSNKFGWLVLNTGNKSEISVGYTTLYGDMAGGFAVLDAILESYVEGDQGVADIVARGFDAPTVKRVIAMVDRNEYKRRQGAIGIKITPRAFGKDWRLPIVNKFRE